ncbi:hypothetical protein AN958_09763 [Leucoagaricus sp. SymC.cos]|nr:hypothetical protein AN958_09763 [Leucoagaricus sp. SymC.cos]
MGVAGLWDVRNSAISHQKNKLIFLLLPQVLKPAATTRSLTELAVTEGFKANPRGLRGYRIGIDASIWFFHAEYGKEGENPVLRTLFFRCATLMKAPFLPLFVFDGPKRPEFKRGKKINKAGNKLIPGMKRIVEAFGFEWRMAPGEAEAELAYLNRIGVIDGILSDDVDNFLFGALTVIRNQSNNLSGNKANPVLNSEGRDDRNHTRVFRFQDLHDHPDIKLTRGGLILIGIMSGGDYEGGLERCGIATAHALARCGFGDTLFDAARNLTREDLVAFLDNWRQELRHELKTNSRGLMARKALSLAKSLPDTFPNIDVLLSYVTPVTSESLGHEGSNPKITWSKEPNVAALASACELFFEWGYKEAIIKRFRTVIWPGTVLRILRRSVLEVDALSTTPTTPHKCHRKTVDDEEGYGTPSKMIAQHFADISLNDSDDDNSTDEHRLIASISRERAHASTDGLPEYRLEVAPKQLVEIAVSGLQGLRQPEGPNEWASDEDVDDDDDEGAPSKKVKVKEPVDPMSHLRLWMPTCMVDPVERRLVREYRNKEERKKQKKRAPVKKKASTKKAQEEEEPMVSPPPARKKASTKKAPEKKLPDDSPPCKTTSATSTSTTRKVFQPRPQAKANSKTLPKLLVETPPRSVPQPFPIDFVARREEEEESSDDDEGELPTVPILPKPKPLPPPAPTTILEKPSSSTRPKSKINQVAAIFESTTSSTTTSLPSLQAIEDALALSESDEELLMNLYQTTRPTKPIKVATSNIIPGYLSLSDDDINFHKKSVSPTKRKKLTLKKQGTIQTMLSGFVQRVSRKPDPDNQDDRPGTPPVQKTPRKSKTQNSPRSTDSATKTTKEGSSIIIISDESDSGYSGLSRPLIAPLQLARSRAKGASTSACSKPTSICDVIDLT